MRSLLTMAFVVLLAVGAFKLFYRPAVPPVSEQSRPSTSAPAIASLPDRVAEPASSVLSPDQLKKVIETTRDPNPNVRWEAVRFLEKSHAPEADSIIEDMMSRDTDADLRRNVVMLLGQQGGLNASRLLITALQDMEPAVRIAAIQGLNRIGDYSAAPAISSLLQDSNDGVRLAALASLNALQVKRDEQIRIQRRKEEAERQRQEELARQEAAQKGK